MCSMLKHSLRENHIVAEATCRFQQAAMNPAHLVCVLWYRDLFHILVGAVTQTGPKLQMGTIGKARGVSELGGVLRAR